jgi:hypothetical protein
VIWPSTVTIDGAAYPLAGILADVTIHHGRTDVFDDPSPDTCQITLHDVTKAFVRSVDTGAPLTLDVIETPGGAVSSRFKGTITDAGLDVDVLSMIAVGRLGTLTQYTIGTSNWPAESWSARVTRIFTEAGLAAILDLYPDPLFNPQLAARDASTAGSTTLGDYLAFLAPMVGAAVADRMSGHILVQAIGSRVLAGAFLLDPAYVEYAPAWSLVLPMGNIVKVTYQADQGASVTVQDAASIAQYGPRPVTIDTAFANVADATTRANTRLGRGSFAHWNIPAAPVIVGLTGLAIGQPLQLSHMPAASPFDPWTPIVEGWTDRISGDEWRMDLALSDPLASGLTLPWNAIPTTAEYHWNTIDQTTHWADALTLEDLHA